MEPFLEAFFYAIFPFALNRFGKFSRQVLWAIIPAC
jgi:hypothetical protein